MKSSEGEKISAVLILEVLGRPPEHLTETLKELIEKMGEETGVSVKKSQINEPNLIKDQKDFYTTFAEIEIETQGIQPLIAVIFKYAPSHVEIIYPERIVMENVHWNAALNEITRRLHSYDEVARILQNENLILEAKLKEITGKKEK